VAISTQKKSVANFFEIFQKQKRTNMGKSTSLVMVIKNIYTL